MKIHRFCLIITCGVWLASLAHVQSQPYVWTTIAGSTNCASADGTNTEALFRYPAGIALDHAGNLYVADCDANTIRMLRPVGPDWVVTTLAGLPGTNGAADGTNSDARFYNPIGVAVDAKGVLYVTDALNREIRMVTPIGSNWVVSTLAGGGFYDGGSQDGTNSSATFWFPEGIVVDSAGNLFVTDYESQTVRRITPIGTNWVVTTLAGAPGQYGTANGTNSDARFYYPASITMDNAGNLLVAGMHDHMIRKVTPVGTNWVVTTLAGVANNGGTTDGTNDTARFLLPTGVTVDRAGNVFVVDQ